MSETEDKVLTKELEEELKAYRFFTDEKEFLWVPPPFLKSEIPKEEWPVVNIKCRDGISIAKAEDDLGYQSKNDKLYTSSGTSRINALKKDIVNWKNIKDAKGNEVPFKRDGKGLVPDSLIRKMPLIFQTGIYDAINKQSRLTPEELAGLEF